eukprot:1558459-Rhodomonas_salina.2
MSLARGCALSQERMPRSRHCVPRLLATRGTQIRRRGSQPCLSRCAPWTSSSAVRLRMTKGSRLPQCDFSRRSTARTGAAKALYTRPRGRILQLPHRAPGKTADQPPPLRGLR